MTTVAWDAPSRTPATLDQTQHMNVTDLAGRTVLVTGAGSGIGRATVLAMARRGANAVICDINAEGLRATEKAIVALGREAFAQCVDVADRRQMEAFSDAVHERVEAVDILVNNAGVALGGGVLELKLDDWDWIVSINLMGVVHGCHFFVPRMVQRGRGGHVVNICSTAGFAASETMAAYVTTKFGVLGFSESLRDELFRRNIGVTAVCPGIINTPITRAARLRGQAANPKAQAHLIAIFERRNYPPERVAENILKAIQRNRAVAPISPEAWFMYYLKRLSPWLVATMTRKLDARLRRELGVGGLDSGKERVAR
jgi:NAD(P)-dependent dehydrogenase (short-subunit alcohol dehydrogenase family)